MKNMQETSDLWIHNSPKETEVQLTYDVIWSEVRLVDLYRKKIIADYTFVNWLHHHRWIGYYK